MHHHTISVKNLRKEFKQDKHRPGILGSFINLFHRETVIVKAVDAISFEIAEGEFVGFVGPNGAGKTTTLKMLSGILHPTSGEVSVLGFDPSKRQNIFKKSFSLVLGQKNQLWWDLPVIDSFEFSKVVYEISDELYEKQKALLCILLQLDELLTVPVRKLSLGQRMKCELAAALLHKPRVLFLDEPTIGLDVISQKNIRDFLQQYNKEEKATIILTSHYMEDIRRLCDRVMIIDHGQLIYDGGYQSLVQQHAGTKTIELIFSEPVERATLEPFGTVADFRETSARLIVPRGHVSEITTKLLASLPIDDISIHEQSMEEIVSEIFQRK